MKNNSFLRSDPKTTPFRPCWRNCALRADKEMQEIDRLEDRLSPVDENASRIRELISSLELCHHKAERWVQNILEAIGRGETDKGLGTRPPGRTHPAEVVWQDACDALSVWLEGRPVSPIARKAGQRPAARLLTGLGDRDERKEWQVRRVREKIRSLLTRPRTSGESGDGYEWLLLGGDGYESFYRSTCPEPYKDHEDFWLQTARTIIHDTADRDPARLSLALAIDMLWPCHWNFPENLRIVLDAVGGNLHPGTPFTACGRNIRLLPNRRKFEAVADVLRAFGSAGESSDAAGREMLARLGEPADEKRWLARSLEKTIRLQLTPPAGMRDISALAGPDWLEA